MNTGDHLASKDPLFAFQSINAYHKWIRSADFDILRSLLELDSPFKKPMRLPAGLTTKQVGCWLNWQDLFVQEVDQRLWPIKNAVTSEPSEHIQSTLNLYGSKSREFAEIETMVFRCLSVSKSVLILLFTEYISADDRTLFEQFLSSTRSAFDITHESRKVSLFSFFGRGSQSLKEEIESLVVRVEQRATLYLRALSRGTSLNVELERDLERWSSSELLNSRHKIKNKAEHLNKLDEALSEAESDQQIRSIAYNSDKDVLLTILIDRMTECVIGRHYLIAAQFVSSEELDLTYVRWIKEQNQILFEEPILVLKAWLAGQRIGIFLARELLDVFEFSDESDSSLLSLYITALANDNNMAKFYMNYLLDYCKIDAIRIKASDVLSLLNEPIEPVLYEVVV